MVEHYETSTPKYVYLMDVAYVLSMILFYEMEETHVLKVKVYIQNSDFSY